MRRRCGAPGSASATRISVDDQVDDWYAVFEWNEGGIIHAHMAFWVVGAPRIDKVDAPCGQEGGSDGIEIHVPLPGQHAVLQAEAADRLPAFWDRAYTEYNVAKAMSSELAAPGSASGDLRALRAIRRWLGGRRRRASGTWARGRQAGPISREHLARGTRLLFLGHAGCRRP